MMKTLKVTIYSQIEHKMANFKAPNEAWLAHNRKRLNAATLVILQRLAK